MYENIEQLWAEKPKFRGYHVLIVYADAGGAVKMLTAHPTLSDAQVYAQPYRGKYPNISWKPLHTGLPDPLPCVVNIIEGDEHVEVS